MKIFGNRLYMGYLFVTVIFVLLLLVSGYFNIGLLSDDYVNIYSANVSTLLEKFTSNVIFHNHLLLRPFWFLSLCLDIFIKKSLSLPSDNFVVFRLHNLLLYLLFAFIISYTLYFLIRDKFLSLLVYAVVLLFPNNIHSLLWVVCRHDTQFGIFGLLSLLLLLIYEVKNNYIILVLSLISFGAALLFKETAIVFPFVILVSLHYFKRGNRTLKYQTYSFYFAILFVYTLYKVFFLNSSAGNILNNYSFSLADRFSVLPKTIFSLFSSADYLSLNYYFRQWDIANLSMEILPLMLTSIILFLIYKERLKKLFVLLLLFVVLIMPNIIAGYFRPQLIIVPFSVLLLFIMFDASFLSDKNKLYLRYVLLVLVILFAFESYSRLSDYKLAYNKLKDETNIISGEITETNKIPVFLFLPSRLKQTYILDNVSATYNYYKYNDFVIHDTLKGFVNYAVLDIESLNSEIIVNKINDTTLTALCSGKTQFFYNIDNNSISDYENDYIKCEFQKDNKFLNKSKGVKITLKNISKCSYIALTNDKATNINLF